jgi:hypothetical protein
MKIPHTLLLTICQLLKNGIITGEEWNRFWWSEAKSAGVHGMMHIIVLSGPAEHKQKSVVHAFWMMTMKQGCKENFWVLARKKYIFWKHIIYINHHIVRVARQYVVWPSFLGLGFVSPRSWCNIWVLRHYCLLLYLFLAHVQSGARRRASD